jgi:hypothetical protein
MIRIKDEPSWENYIDRAYRLLSLWFILAVIHYYFRFKTSRRVLALLVRQQIAYKTSARVLF